MASRNLHLLPKLEDRWSHLYLEHGRVEQDKNGLVFVRADGDIATIPLDQFAMIQLGPGTSITHAAIRVLADNNTLIAWSGEQGVRMYSFSTGGTHSARRIIRQAELWADPEKRLRVIYRMYAHRFPDPIPAGTTLEQIRGMEGYRVREAYRTAASYYGIDWQGRNYDQRDWSRSDPVNRALSAATACLYGICHAAILTAGYSAALGFIHTGKQLSFVYDIADLYKTEIAVPIAFSTAAESPEDVERRARIASRDAFYESKLLSRVLKDIAKVLDAGDDSGELPFELEGKAVSLADGTEIGGLPGESILPDP